ncbi:hypothetical protein Fot_10104 [Forsythia ovata]|uniref:Uncharacterized protein n=1 Tax=Forsythia ovata TaxID=205694 RepID=A0ABD1WFW1_9LAMI
MVFAVVARFQGWGKRSADLEALNESLRDLLDGIQNLKAGNDIYISSFREAAVSHAIGDSVENFFLCTAKTLMEHSTSLKMTNNSNDNKIVKPWTILIANITVRIENHIVSKTETPTSNNFGEDNDIKLWMMKSNQESVTRRLN